MSSVNAVECTERIEELFNNVVHNYSFWGLRHDLKEDLTKPSKQINDFENYFQRFLLTSPSASTIGNEITKIDKENLIIQRYVNLFSFKNYIFFYKNYIFKNALTKLFKFSRLFIVSMHREGM